MTLTRREFIKHKAAAAAAVSAGITLPATDAPWYFRLRR